MDGYLLACGSLFIAGLILNCTDSRMLAITMLVGISIFIPVPASTAFNFYAFCIFAEMVVGIVAYLTGKEAGIWVGTICIVLIVSHCMGYSMDGSTPLSPYRIIVKILELSQLGICAALSPVMAPILRNRDATTI